MENIKISTLWSYCICSITRLCYFPPFTFNMGKEFLVLKPNRRQRVAGGKGREGGGNRRQAAVVILAAAPAPGPCHSCCLTCHHLCLLHSHYPFPLSYSNSLEPPPQPGLCPACWLPLLLHWQPPGARSLSPAQPGNSGGSNSGVGREGQMAGGMLFDPPHHLLPSLPSLFPYLFPHCLSLFHGFTWYSTWGTNLRHLLNNSILDMENYNECMNFPGLESKYPNLFILQVRVESLGENASLQSSFWFELDLESEEKSFCAHDISPKCASGDPGENWTLKQSNFSNLKTWFKKRLSFGPSHFSCTSLYM